MFLRVNGQQLMVLSDAIPGLRIEGKPQCHIVAIAKEQGVIAASVGCALSRVRTGMPRDRDDVRDPGRPRSATSIERDRAQRGGRRRRRAATPSRRTCTALLQLSGRYFLAAS